jgi:hypothetical protein
VADLPALTKLTDRFTETISGDEVVIMRIETGEFLAMSGTAAAVWRLIDGHRDRAGLIAALAVEFGVDGDRITGEVDEFLGDLRNSEILADV